MIGIDEVGRGCIAGPLLVVAARKKSLLPTGLKDSKQLTKIKRERLIDSIRASCDLGEGWVTTTEIDTLGITKAMKLGVKRALTAIKAEDDEVIIIDGHINYCEVNFLHVQAIIKADAIRSIVSAASVYAKVQRDLFMCSLSEPYEKYEFNRHVGYGTKRHIMLLNKYGVSDMHRRSFAPIKAML